MSMEYTTRSEKYPDASLIKVVTSYRDLESADSTQTVDVTGGMGGKLGELLELAKIGIESEIINAGHDNNIKKALKGENGIGTLIRNEK